MDGWGKGWKDDWLVQRVWFKIEMRIIGWIDGWVGYSIDGRMIGWFS